jgi:hypothetical protein
LVEILDCLAAYQMTVSIVDQKQMFLFMPEWQLGTPESLAHRQKFVVRWRTGIAGMQGWPSTYIQKSENGPLHLHPSGRYIATCKRFLYHVRLKLDLTIYTYIENTVSYTYFLCEGWCILRHGVYHTITALHPSLCIRLGSMQNLIVLGCFEVLFKNVH